MCDLFRHAQHLIHEVHECKVHRRRHGGLGEVGNCIGQTVGVGDPDLGVEAGEPFLKVHDLSPSGVHHVACFPLTSAA